MLQQAPHWSRLLSFSAPAALAAAVRARRAVPCHPGWDTSGWAEGAGKKGFIILWPPIPVL